ncbi:MAG: alcohol dehydrogenase catalytic domain-containing protein, partial [Desulfobacterales bacterium]|nr:alcohol dehydrogenase catalytic domain-containing protein [Desulfobacterales bacterium]
MKTTKQIIFTQPGKWEIREIKLPELKEDEVIVKVEACGLCTWERHIFDGKENVQFPFAGGHEIAATIVKKGTKVSSSLQIGDKVAVAKWDRCNECYDCRRGFDNHCGSNFLPIESDQVWGPGGFSEYLIAKSYEVYKLFGDNDVHYAALTEPVACVTRAISKAKLQANDTSVVIGAGVMGLLFLKLLKLRGQKVILVELSEYRRSLAEKMGANVVIDPTKTDWVDEVHSFTNQRGATSIFYTAGGIDVLNKCL